MPSKKLMDFLKTQGHDVKSHMSTIAAPVAAILKDRIKPVAPPPAKTDPSKTSSGRQGAGSSSSRGSNGRDDNASGRGGGRSSWLDQPKGGGARSGDSGSGRGGGDARGGGRNKRVRVFFGSEDYGSGGGGGGRRRGGRGNMRRGDHRGGSRGSATAQIKLPEKIEVSPPTTVKELSAIIGMKAQALLKELFKLGKPVTINQYLDEELILELCMELGIETEFKKKEEDLEDAVKAIEDFESDEKLLEPRAPVVTFLGHVDHGKTSLLDKIRETQITNKEHGGITQHLGAYRVDKGDTHVTFIDTPGHKAFTEMRARGANVTDVAVLVVAADDGPMPQTEEAINHARAAEVPIVVAVNKIDRPNANLDKTKQALSALGLQPVEWGGKTELVEVSAITGQGIDSLIETLGLETEILELKANPQRSALGVVLEAEATTTRGVLATCLVQDGTLRLGDYILCGASHGRVRDMILNGTDQVEEAGPSVPVTIVGLNTVPPAGEKFYVFENEKQARQLADEREFKLRENERAERYSVKKVSLEDYVAQMGAGGTVDLKLILKADVRGSIEALRTSLENLSTEEVRVTTLHTGVGAITQEDVHLAAASEAIIIGFHVLADDRARVLAEEEGVDIRHYKVIYEAIEEVRAAMEKRLAPERIEESRGRAEIRQVFKASKIGNIAGCMVLDGKISRNDKVRVLRDGEVLFTGDMSSLKRVKDDVKEVKEGFECGIKVSGFEAIEPGDIIESFTIVEKARKLS